MLPKHYKHLQIKIVSIFFKSYVGEMISCICPYSSRTDSAC